MNSSVYLETTIVSYYCSRPNRDIIISARQQLTELWWDTQMKNYNVFISDLVLEESAKGDTDAASKRLDAISAFQILEIDEESAVLAKGLISKKAIPAEFPEDALHIAVAAINGMDFILTLNFAHINNAMNREKIMDIIDQFGLICPVICTPEELLGS